MLGTLGHEMILKVRVAGSEDPDYIEVELPGDSLTLESLILVASAELEVKAGAVERVRRMPNTRLRRDKEVSWDDGDERACMEMYRKKYGK